MDGVRDISDRFTDSANEFWTTVGDYLPKLFGALVLLILALIAAKIAQAVVERVLKAVRVDQLSKNKQVARTLKSAEVSIDLVSIAGRIVFWAVIIIFALTIADVLELTAMTDVIREILNYLPNVLAAVIVLTVTVAGARLVRDLVRASLVRMQVDFAHNVSSVAFYVLVVFGGLMAIDQLGFDTTILSANVTVLVAGVTLALALAFGLGGRDAAKSIVDESYANYKRSVVRKKR
jgi:hypothetical protein